VAATAGGSAHSRSERVTAELAETAPTREGSNRYFQSVPATSRPVFAVAVAWCGLGFPGGRTSLVTGPKRGLGIDHVSCFCRVVYKIGVHQKKEQKNNRRWNKRTSCQGLSLVGGERGFGPTARYIFRCLLRSMPMQPLRKDGNVYVSRDQRYRVLSRRPPPSWDRASHQIDFPCTRLVYMKYAVGCCFVALSSRWCRGVFCTIGVLQLAFFLHPSPPPAPKSKIFFKLAVLAGGWVRNHGFFF